ncbi:hypothetical protein H632_c4716p0 [Helicosporidium sp. ATCC 50920]|nr:hypothetical protein H632_c4716p0 [Helicosporidium sp. ATCC 50920]|eukprot:KDD71599.1 hypothetical protein H632_c4716p0 [Helicosporidium sp. ATCC 50920]
MERNPEDFRGFLGADWERYLRGMATASMPGDELALRALADAYGVNVSIVTAEKSQWVLRYAPRQTLSDREVFLLWHGGEVPIYMMLRRESAWTTLCTSLTGQSGGWLRKDAVHPDTLDGYAL